MSGALRRKRKAQARAREAALAAEKRATVGGWTTRHGRTSSGEFVKSKTRVTRSYRGAAGPCVEITIK